jgi:cupin 2 domain-containing protein
MAGEVLSGHDVEALSKARRTDVTSGNLRGGFPSPPRESEIVDVLLDRPDVRVECIVSTGQTTPEGEWYDQETDEWVLVLAGAARLRIEGEDKDRELGEGDWIFLPARCRHRVTWTRHETDTVWLAIHVKKPSGSAT